MAWPGVSPWLTTYTIATIEDLVPSDLYLSAVRAKYKALGLAKWVPEGLDPDQPVLEQLNGALKDRDLGPFDKVGVATEVARQLRADPSRVLSDQGLSCCLDAGTSEPPPSPS